MTEGATQTASRAPMRIAFALCFMVALTEGIDIMSAGLAAPKLIAEFGLSPSQLGLIFSANSVGLLVGAMLGGWLADRIGRGRALLFSMITLGLFSIATAFATGAASLIAMRLAIGVGLGGAMPNMIALAAELGAPERRASRVTAITVGMPVGSAMLSGALSLAPPDMDWRVIFYFGGGLPLLLAPMIWWAFRSDPLPVRDDRPVGEATTATGAGEVLFGGGRASATLLLWTAFFFTLIVSYLLLNWLPTLLVETGFSEADAMVGTTIYSLGSITGAPVLGYFYDRVSRPLVISATYLGIVLSLGSLAFAGAAHGPAFTAIFFTGVFLVGSQFLLYGIATNHYPHEMRGRGVGFSVAAGRLGSIMGPFVAGALLAAGRTPGQVLLGIMPAILLAFVAVFALNRLGRARVAGR